MTCAVIWLLIGVAAGEALLFHDRRTGNKTRPSHYLVAVIFGPIILLLGFFFPRKS